MVMIMTDAPVRAIMWKPDPLADAEFKLDISKILHRQAGVRGFYCSPKKSHIQRGTYYAEVGQHTWEGRPAYSGLVRPNLALGTGRTPLMAAMNGYQLVGLNDEHMKAIYLEIETHYLRQAVKTIGKLELALDDLTGLVRSVNVPYACEDCIGMREHGCYCMSQGCVAPGVPPAYDEDDDL